MSVRSETYLLLGYRLDLEKLKALSEDVEDRLIFPWCGKGAAGTCGLLVDGMSGGYALAGYCILVSDEEHRGGIPLTELDTTELLTQHSGTVRCWLDAEGLYQYRSTGATLQMFLVTHFH